MLSSWGFMPQRPASVLLVTADAEVEAVASSTPRYGSGVTPTPTGAGALRLLDSRSVDVVLFDLDVRDTAPADFATTLARRYAGLPLVVVAASERVGEALELVRKGAADFVRKPLSAGELAFTIEKALASGEGDDDVPPPSRVLGTMILGRSEPMRKVLGFVDRAAKSNASVLVRGETGSGKELVARRIHELSPRAKGPFLKVHCAALPEQLLESELFGYEKGAFTGAQSRKPGRVELASGGTLFLDEIGDISAATQVKLLRIIQDRKYERLGGSETLDADVRFVTATHRNLEEMIARNQFREDLYYRINVISITVPPLRQRADDVSELVPHFVQSACQENGCGPIEIQKPAVELLARFNWPGNVRQLQNVVERLVVMADGPVVGASDVSAELERIGVGTSKDETEPAAAVSNLEASAILLSDAVGRAEKRVLEKALKRAAGNRMVAARILGISRRTLYYKMEEHGLEGSGEGER